MKIYSPTHGYVTSELTHEVRADGSPVTKIGYTSDPTKAHNYVAAEAYVKLLEAFGCGNDFEVEP